MKTDAIPSVAILFKKIATPDLIKKSSAAKGFLHCAFPVREGVTAGDGSALVNKTWTLKSKKLESEI